jgi:hypothetical protein
MIFLILQRPKSPGHPTALPRPIRPAHPREGATSPHGLTISPSRLLLSPPKTTRHLCLRPLPAPCLHGHRHGDPAAMLARAPRLGAGTSTSLLSPPAVPRSRSLLSPQAPHRHCYSQRKASRTGLFPQVPKSQQIKPTSWFQRRATTLVASSCWIFG